MSVPAANAAYILQQFHLRLGDPYIFGGDYSQTDTTQGADCSYVAGWVLEGMTNGPADMSWAHNVSTESWPFDYTTNTPAAPGTVGPYGTVAVALLADVPADAALLINIMHGGGGEDSHMNCVLQGQILESNGDDGTCTNGTGGTLSTDPIWTDHWYLSGPIEGAVVTRNGLDYAGGRPSGAAIKAAGYDFVCRYLSDGGTGLPGKLLIPSEVADLHANGIDIVSNWETTGTTALNGFDAGVSDAQQADAAHQSLGGGTAPIYFSLDWDEAPTQDSVVDQYFQGVASVIGLERTGAYGAYWILTRLQAAGLITWTWQTEAWSGDNQDTVLNILQDNNAGYATVDGIQCDIDYALTEDFGQWNQSTPGVFDMLTAQQQQDLYNWAMWTYAQAQGFNPAMVELSIPGCTPTVTGSGWGILGTNSAGQSLTPVAAMAAIQAGQAAIQAAILELAAQISGTK